MSTDLFAAPASASPLDITIGTDEWALVLHLRGEIDMSSAPTLTRCLEAAVGEHTGDVVVDLAEVAFLDSSGLNALIRARNQLAQHGRSLRARRPTAAVARVFAVSGTSELLLLDDDAQPTVGD